MSTAISPSVRTGSSRCAPFFTSRGSVTQAAFRSSSISVVRFQPAMKDYNIGEDGALAGHHWDPALAKFDFRFFGACVDGTFRAACL
jgi:hypothetical protein